VGVLIVPLIVHGRSAPTTRQAVGTRPAPAALLDVSPNVISPPAGRDFAYDGAVTENPPAVVAAVPSQRLTTVAAVSKESCHGLSAVPEVLRTRTADWKPAVHSEVVLQVTWRPPGVGVGV